VLQLVPGIPTREAPSDVKLRMSSLFRSPMAFNLVSECGNVNSHEEQPDEAMLRKRWLVSIQHSGRSNYDWSW
jgi:hypothetical protein